MGKIKYQGAVTKIIAQKIAQKERRQFSSGLYSGKLKPVYEHGKKTDVDLASFSCSRDLEEQVLSILTFVRYAGAPANFYVYSDGTYTLQQIAILEGLFPFVKVRLWDEQMVNPRFNSETLELYAGEKPLGKKLFAYMNHEIKRPTIFLDSDILFYAKAGETIEILRNHYNGWFLMDVSWGCLDSRLLSNIKQDLYQCNSGFIFVNREIDWQPGLDFINSLGRKFEYFSEQTAIHITLGKNNFRPLDPRLFIMETDDQFDFSYGYPIQNIAMRHYVSPVRHKMWQKNWRWQLNLKNH